MKLGRRSKPAKTGSLKLKNQEIEKTSGGSGQAGKQAKLLVLKDFTSKCFKLKDLAGVSF
jgi:hypothetical protein